MPKNPKNLSMKARVREFVEKNRVTTIEQVVALMRPHLKLNQVTAAGKRREKLRQQRNKVYTPMPMQKLLEAGRRVIANELLSHLRVDGVVKKTYKGTYELVE